MLSKTRGIVLHTIPYNDKYAIIYVYTEAYGRVSYLVSRNRGKRSTVTKTLFIPLSVLELEVDHSNSRDLQRIKESKCCQPLYSVSTNPVKNVLALFISEVLYRVLKETESNPRLFSYLCQSIHVLEQTDEGIANYHIVFLMELLRYLGVFPHVDTYQTNYYFDMQNGVFVDQMPTHKYYLNRLESAIFSRLLRISYENMSLYSFSRHDRVLIVHRILDYYRLHLPEFPEIKSFAVLQSLFD